MGKGSRARPRDMKRWAENYEAIFGHVGPRPGKSKKKRKQRPEPNRCNTSSRFGKAAHGPFPRHYSWHHGRRLNSWSDYHKANKELDIIDCGQKPGFPKDTTVPHSPKVGVHVPIEEIR